MYTLRCTQRLRRRLPMEVTVAPPVPTTKLGDWYANVLFVRHQHLVLCTSERSLLSVIVPAKDPAQLPVRLRNGVRSLLLALGLPPATVATEIHEMAQLLVSKTANRSVLGTMNDIVHHCRWHGANRPTFDVRALEFELAEMPALTREFAFPREEAARLLGAA
ncbi:MAG: hypothetical protein ACE5FJ_10590 [Gemmatimonadales bacterium]